MLPTIEATYLQKSKERDFDETKLEPVKLPLKNLSTSKDKRNELWDLQKNRQEYAKWKKELANLTKKKRLLQNDFRSGALNVDNPLEEQSFYYNEIGKEMKKKHELSSFKEENHRKYLDDHIKTSENIGFSHRHAWNRTLEKLNDFDDLKKQNVDDFWKVKKKNSLYAVRNKRSKERIFGSEQNKTHLLGRAELLRERETHNRKYNIVTLNYYEPEIVEDAFLNRREKNYQDFYFKN